MSSGVARSKHILHEKNAQHLSQDAGAYCSVHMNTGSCSPGTPWCRTAFHGVLIPARLHQRCECKQFKCRALKCRYQYMGNNDAARRKAAEPGRQNGFPGYLQSLLLLLITASKQEGSPPTDTVRVLNHRHNPPWCLLSPTVIC